MPTIVLHGACDGVIPPTESEDAQRHFGAHYERQVIAVAGHFLSRETPDVVVQAVQTLAKKFSPRSKDETRRKQHRMEYRGVMQKFGAGLAGTATPSSKRLQNKFSAHLTALQQRVSPLHVGSTDATEVLTQGRADHPRFYKRRILVEQIVLRDHVAGRKRGAA